MPNHQNHGQWISVAAFFFAVATAAFPHTAKAQDQPAASTTVSHRDKILLKLKSITLSVNFDKMDIAAVLDFLSKKSKELDPDKEGINFVLRLPDDTATESGTTTPHPKIHREVSMTLDNIPLADLLQEISQQTNLQFTVEDYAVFFHPIN